MVVYRWFNWSKSSKNTWKCRRTSQFIANLGVTVRWNASSLINGSDEMHQCKFLWLSHSRWIGDGLPRWSYIARLRNNTWNAIGLILIKRFGCVFVGLISDVITLLMNGWDYIVFKMILQRVILRHVPLPLSDDRRSRFNRVIEHSTLCQVIYRSWLSIAIDRTL